ncbi:MAG: DUF3604 domain-containing protein, partial [Pseudomonadota bacterium]
MTGIVLILATTAAAQDDGCPDARATRNVYFGDLHIHTRFSHDAFTITTQDDPAQTYEGVRARLDFAAVTDHAEFLAETLLCQRESLPAYDEPGCVELRAGRVRPSQLRQICAPGSDVPLGLCNSFLDDVWSRTRAAASGACRSSQGSAASTFAATVPPKCRATAARA